MELACTLKATALNPDVGDLRLSGDGLDELVYGDEVRLTRLADEVAQRLMVRLNLFQGEWKRDLAAGLPYYQHILKKGANDQVIRAVFSQVILGCEGVAALLSFFHTVGKDRKMELRFTCRLADGTLFKSSDYGRFLVTV